MVKSILFVCTGNICRSPMAMALFKGLIGDREWRIESAGTWAEDGLKASEFAVTAMAERGLSLSQHRSRVVTGEMLHSFNLIVTMEEGQQEALQVEFPDIRQRVFLLSKIAGGSGNIKDPIGLGLDEYQKTADEIERLLRSGLKNISQLAGM